jgi:hypothetical protein
LIHLAFILFPQLGGQALEKIAMDYLEEEEEDPEMIIEEKEDEENNAEEIMIIRLEVEKDDLVQEKEDIDSDRSYLKPHLRCS